MNVALEPLVIQRTGSSPVSRYSCLHSHSHEVHGAFTRPLRPSSTTRYISAFDKAFYWMQFTSKPATTILVYNYRADLTKGAAQRYSQVVDPG